MILPEPVVSALREHVAKDGLLVDVVVVLATKAADELEATEYGVWKLDGPSWHATYGLLTYGVRLLEESDEEP